MSNQKSSHLFNASHKFVTPSVVSLRFCQQFTQPLYCEWCTEKEKCFDYVDRLRIISVGNDHSHACIHAWFEQTFKFNLQLYKAHIAGVRLNVNGQFIPLSPEIIDLGVHVCIDALFTLSSHVNHVARSP